MNESWREPPPPMHVPTRPEHGPPPWQYGQGQPSVPGPTAPNTGKWSKKKIFALVSALIVAGLLGLGGLIAALGIFSVSAAAENVPPDAQIGECFAGDKSKRTVPCDGSHQYEVFSAVVYDLDMGYPSKLEISLGNQICNQDFEAYTGENYYTSDFDYQEVFPSEADWDGGDRLVVCALYNSSFGEIGRRFDG